MADSVQTAEHLEQEVRQSLKDFQLATVDRVMEIFVPKEDQEDACPGRKRVLVSDEVGLGKTMIAQGVIAAMAKRKGSTSANPLNVVYICSNAVIAEQNLNKLRFSDSIRKDDVVSSRLSMQHLQMEQRREDASYKNQFIHLIPLMPYTSFTVSGGGTAQERALIYAILKPTLQEIWEEERTKKPPNKVLVQLDQVIEPLGKLMEVDARLSWQYYYDRYVKELQRPERQDYLKRMIAEAKEKLCKETAVGRAVGTGADKKETTLLDEVCRITWNWWIRWNCSLRLCCPFSRTCKIDPNKQVTLEERIEVVPEDRRDEAKQTFQKMQKEQNRQKELLDEKQKLEEKLQQEKDEQKRQNIQGELDELAKKIHEEPVIQDCPPKRLGSDAYRMFEKLRLMFAEISLKELKPDLVIMDEFQRFRDILTADPATDNGMLRKRFFEESDADMLLLSATPYKMYSTLEEMDETQTDEHYEEFLQVMNFLNESGKANEAVSQERKDFKTVWTGYSTQLKQLSYGDAVHLHITDTSILDEKHKAEDAMYANVCRTERCSASETAEMVKRKDTPLEVSEADVLSYVQAQKVLKDLDSQAKLGSMPIDYVKSCPYVFSYLQGYVLNDRIVKAVEKLRKTRKDKSVDPKTIAQLLHEGKELWLNESTIEGYEEISNNNARLECLMDQVLPKEGKEAQYLWVPPSLPYYPLEGVYENCAGKDGRPFTKTLIFSSWQMVPRMISTLVSYEAEQRVFSNLTRRTVGDSDKGDRYPYRREKDYLKSRLRFRSIQDDGDKTGRRPGQMSLFSLLYPTQYLSNHYNPLDKCYWGKSLTDIKAELEKKIEQALESFSKCAPDEGRPDKAWYYMAPLLLDLDKDDSDRKGYVWQWLEAVKDLDSTAGEEISDDTGASETGKSGNRSNNVGAYVAKLKEMLESVVDAADKSKVEFPLGRPPKHLYGVLADMAIGSPAVCMNRGYQLYCTEDTNCGDLAKQATEAAMVFLRRMDTPEALAIVQTATKAEKDDPTDTEETEETAHWRSLLTYCTQGCLQAVVDEYLHMLASGLPRTKNLVSILHRQFLDGIHIRTANFPVNTVQDFESLCKTGQRKPLRMRTHYAVAFSKVESEKQDRDKEVDRKKVVRQAFNSPFWPFVLATTSIGHEGLDFHNYCRRVVHWNLPANPIDLEQREGRINRYKCLAIRQSVAKRYGQPGPNGFQKDVWEELFARAAQEEKDPGSSDLIPYWGLRKKEDLVPIERVVPAYPLSSDETLYERLIKILSLYRLTLGQAKQEELIGYLEKRFKDVEDLKQLFFNLSPFYRNRDLESVPTQDCP